jgi:hypothetical protein
MIRSPDKASGIVNLAFVLINRARGGVVDLHEVAIREVQSDCRFENSGHYPPASSERGLCATLYTDDIC